MKYMQKISDIVARHRSIIRYIVVGIASLAVDYGMLLMLYHGFDLPLVLSTSLGFFTGLCVNFMLNKYWTFDAPKGAKHSTRQVVLYGMLVAVNLLLTNLIIISCARLQLGPEITKPFATALLTMCNFIVYQKVIFKNHTPTDLERSII